MAITEIRHLPRVKIYIQEDTRSKTRQYHLMLCLIQRGYSAKYNVVNLTENREIRKENEAWRNRRQL
jgi:hypothetical protein